MVSRGRTQFAPTVMTVQFVKKLSALFTFCKNYGIILYLDLNLTQSKVGRGVSRIVPLPN